MNDDTRHEALIDLAYFGAAEAGMKWIDCRVCGEVGRSVWQGQVEACPECGDHAYLEKHPTVQTWQKFDRNITSRLHALLPYPHLAKWARAVCGQSVRIKPELQDTQPLTANCCRKCVGKLAK